MAVPKTVTGARAIVKVGNNAVGVFDSCSYTNNIGAEPIFTLGKYGPHEIAPVSYEAVMVNCSGYRVIDSGPQSTTGANFPKIDDLLTLEAVNISVIDRQVGADGKQVVLANISGCIPVTNAGNFNAKTTSKIQISYLGILLETDERSLPGTDGEGKAVALTSATY